MEEHLVQLLGGTLSSNVNDRRQAELNLGRAKTNPEFPLALARIGGHTSLGIDVRQAALSQLRQFVEDNWSPEDAWAPGITIAEATKEHLRAMLLELVLSPEDQRKMKTAASIAVTKIAMVDFPENWPTLLPTVLGVMPSGTDVQLHGALVILQDLVDESLTDEQFFRLARDIIRAVYDIAMNESRRANHKALAIRIFASCFDLMDSVDAANKKEVKAFADEVLSGWMPFFENVVKTPLPSLTAEALQDGKQPDAWHGPITLKLQVLKTLIKIKTIFPALLLPQSPTFFSAVWDELNTNMPTFQALYLDNGIQGKFEDQDGLPYTLDFLIIEEMDFLNQLMRAKPVQTELESQIKAHGSVENTPWVLGLMKILTNYSRITQEEEGLWDIDVSVFLADETQVSNDYNARSACADLFIKIGEWLQRGALDGLFAYTKTLFASGEVDWRSQEASLYLFGALVSDMQEMDKPVPAEISEAYLELVKYAVNADDSNREIEPLLKARGHLVAGKLAASYSPYCQLMENSIKSMTNDISEVVQVACIAALEGYIESGNVPKHLQSLLLQGLLTYIEGKDMTELEDADDLLVTLLTSLRQAIRMNTLSILEPDSKALEILFTVAKYGARNFQVTMIVSETFEDIVESLSVAGHYATLCAKVLPSLTGAFDVGDMTDDLPLVTLATELVCVLTQFGSEPLPDGFVAATLPKLSRLLLTSKEGEILRPGAEAVRYMLMHDHHQVLTWHDESNRSGLDVCLVIIDRLLGSSVEDNDASEVGGLAAELVEKAGAERLGPFLEQLLRAVAIRLASAQAANFIQSLVLVFARLSLTKAQDVVEFLSQLDIEGQNGLQVVLGKWLENSINFAGYEEIRQNVIALSKLFTLNDPRLAQTMVKGDLIMDTANSGRIMTRSRAKQSNSPAAPWCIPEEDLAAYAAIDPDKYTAIPATLKILKVLIEELLSASGAQDASRAAAAAAGEFDGADSDDDDNDGWEDEPGDTLDLSLPSTKADLMSLIEGGNMRHRDDETQRYLTEFFVTAAREHTAGFQEWYNMLSAEEKAKLEELATQQ